MVDTERINRSLPRQALVAALALLVVGSAFLYLPSAAAASSSLDAIPAKSPQSVGKYEVLKLKFHLDTGNYLDIIRITLDGDKVVEFEADGTVVSAHPVFKKVLGNTKFISDGYAVGPAKGHFMVFVLKSALSVGVHTVESEVVTDVETLTASDTFELTQKKQHLPDLAINGFIKDRNEEAGTPTKVPIAIRNEGKAPSGPFTVSVYMSEDEELDGGDVVIGFKNVGSIAPHTREFTLVNGFIPADTPSGRYYMIVMADSSDAVEESDEDNNTRAERFRVH